MADTNEIKMNPTPEKKEEPQKTVKLDLKNEEAFRDFYRKSLGEVYAKATPENKAKFDERIGEIYAQQKRLADLKVELGVKDNRAVIYDNGIREIEVLDNEDKLETATFEDKIDQLNREVEMLSRERDQIERRLAKMEINPDGKSEWKRRELILSETFEQLQKWNNLTSLTEEQKNGIKSIIGNKSFDAITAGDFYALKKEGYDLSQLLLAREFWWEKVNKWNIKTGDKLIVNFWTNREAHTTIGAGDLLPMDKIYKIKVNGVEWIRGYSPRPGFYNGKQYLPVYDGDKIEIIEEKPFDPAEKATYEKAESDRFKEIRGSEISSWLYNQLRDKNADAHTFTLPYMSRSDRDMLNKYIQDVLPQNVRENLTYDEKTWIISTKNKKPLREVLNTIPQYEWKGTHHLRYMDHINTVEQKYNLPSWIMVRLIYHENGRWDPTLQVPGGTAFWLTQLPNGTWNDVCRWSGLKLDRNNPLDQITAGAFYLNYISRINKTTDGTLLMAYYNTGPWIMRLWPSTIANYSRLNPAVRRRHPSGAPSNAREYFASAVSYYSDIPYEQALAKIT